MSSGDRLAALKFEVRLLERGMKIIAHCMIAAVLLISRPDPAGAAAGATLDKAFKGFFVQLNLGRLPMFDLVMAFDSGGAFYYFRDSKFDYRLSCATGSYLLDAEGLIAAELQDKSYRTKVYFRLFGDLLIGSGDVRGVPPEDAGFNWPFPLYRFVYIGRHTAAADSRAQDFLAECEK